MKRRTILGSVLLVTALAALAIAPVSCSQVPRRDPSGEVFPSVKGTGLDDKTWQIPEDFKGKPVLLLVGYVQNAQFDLDRWLLGLMQAKVDVRLYEVPTIKGLVPGMFSGFIDNGMRSGIPQADWGSVITVYGDAAKIVSLTGNESPRNGRVMLLDGEGRIVWFWDRGYSAGKLMELKERLAGL